MITFCVYIVEHQLSHTAQQKAVLTVFPLDIQTITAEMLSIGRKEIIYSPGTRLVWGRGWRAAPRSGARCGWRRCQCLDGRLRAGDVVGDHRHRWSVAAESLDQSRHKTPTTLSQTHSEWVSKWVTDTIRDAILMCARKPTWVSLIYRTEPTTRE